MQMASKRQQSARALIYAHIQKSRRHGSGEVLHVNPLPPPFSSPIIFLFLGTPVVVYQERRLVVLWVSPRGSDIEAPGSDSAWR